MTNFQNRRRIAWTGIATVLLLHSSPALADSANRDRSERGIVVTFTKWVTGDVPANPTGATPRRLLMAGTVGGDVGAGYFVGEVFDRQPTTPGTVTTPIAALHAVYEVQAGAYSFTALVQGGSNAAGRGWLDGVILSGMRTGSRVHVEFRTLTTCSGNKAGPCFRGTIRILPDSDDSDH